MCVGVTPASNVPSLVLFTTNNNNNDEAMLFSFHQVNPRGKKETKRSGINVNSTWTEWKNYRSTS